MLLLHLVNHVLQVSHEVSPRKEYISYTVYQGHANKIMHFGDMAAPHSSCGNLIAK